MADGSGLTIRHFPGDYGELWPLIAKFGPKIAMSRPDEPDTLCNDRYTRFPVRTYTHHIPPDFQNQGKRHKLARIGPGCPWFEPETPVTDNPKPPFVTPTTGTITPVLYPLRNYFEDFASLSRPRFSFMRPVRSNPGVWPANQVSTE